jgi:hypothetical protein
VPEQIKALIHDPDIKIIGLDIFDTFIERPTILPTDIFMLLQEKAKSIVKSQEFNFHEIRCSIEQEVRPHIFKIT